MTDHRGGKILLVENELIIALAEESTLRGFGYEVITAIDGEAAVKAAAETEDIDLVLMDIDLGSGIDGVEAARRILDSRDLPVVFLTSYYTSEIYQKINDINCSGFAIKNQGDNFLKLLIDNAFRNLNARRDIEKKLIELKLNESKYRAAFMANPEAINIHDMRGRFVDVNTAFMEKTGYTSDELIGRISLKTGLWVNPEDRDRFVEPLLEKGYVENMETLFRMKDGKIITAVMSGKLITINEEPHALVITRDINDRKIIEEKIKESEEKYRATFITSPDSISINSMDGIYIDINDSFSRLTGFSRDEIIGRKVEETGLWAVHDDFVNFIKEINKSGFIENIESTFRCRNGSIKTSFMSARIIRINGEPHILSITRDFTERNKMLEAIRKSEASLAEAEARAHLGSWEADFINNKSTWSEEMFRIFGINPKQGPLENVNQLYQAIHPDDMDLVKNNEFRIVNEKRPFTTEYRIIRQNDKAVRWCESYFDPIMNEDGEVTGVAGTVLDITERKLATESLKESEEKFRSIAENISDMIFITDADGIITYLSDSSMDIFGYSPDEMVGHFFGEYLSGEELEKAYPKFEEAIRTGTPAKGIDLIANRKDGSTFYMELNSSIIKKHNQVVGTLGLMRDITERKMSEDQIKKLLKEKELLLKEVHHRVKNNMSIIMSLLSLQADNLKDPGAASALMDARVRMQSMGVLYDKLYRSESFVEMSISDYLDPLVDEIVAMFPKRADIKIEKNIEDFYLPYRVLSPIGILANEILTNTIKHAFNGRTEGIIRVSFSVISKDAVLTIQDNGVGIPEPADLEKTSGFGLQLVRMLTTQIGGKMKLEREDGTMFKLEFKV